MKQQLETIAVIGRSSNVSLFSPAQDWNVASSGISTTLRNQISVKIALGRPSKSVCNIIPPDIDSIIVPSWSGTGGYFVKIQPMDGRAYPILAPTVRKGGGVNGRLIYKSFIWPIFNGWNIILDCLYLLNLLLLT